MCLKRLKTAAFESSELLNGRVGAMQENDEPHVEIMHTLQWQTNNITLYSSEFRVHTTTKRGVTHVVIACNYPLSAT